MLTDPTARPDAIASDFSNLVVVIAQTGDEWSTTGRLVQHYILPLLRKHNIRLVELARRGPTKKDVIAVLQDTRQPYRLHLDGVYKLSRENRHHAAARRSPQVQPSLHQASRHARQRGFDVELRRPMSVNPDVVQVFG